MSENPKNSQIMIEEQQGDENLLGFFRLLFEIDCRLHPENYKELKNKKDD